MQDDNWVKAMQEEVDQYQKNDVWKLVKLPKGNKVVGAKWVFRNKLDENGMVLRNKTRLVSKGYSPQEGIDYKETNAHVACLEAIQILLSFVTHSNMMLYQMDVKITFLNKLTPEEVYVEQPPRFDIFSHHAFKLNKTLYGLKQAPSAWYEKLSSFLLKNGFGRGKMDTTLFHKTCDSQFLLVQVYVDDIIFSATNDMLYEDFSQLM